MQGTEVYAADGLSLQRIYDSGQCFRWRDEKDESFLIPSAGHIVLARQTGEDRIWLSCDEEEFRAYWRGYLDLDTDYAKIAAMIRPQDAFLTRAAEAGRGIRILRQDLWETLITFILSQRKNIPAIRCCVERLCGAAGTSEMTCEPLAASTEPRDVAATEKIRRFPSAEEILAADAAGKLDACGLGYRLPYIRAVAGAFSSPSQAVPSDTSNHTETFGTPNQAEAVSTSNQEEVMLSRLSLLSDEDLLADLMQLKGVGVKVAKCTMLFGFHRLDAFPVDVWISRALAEEYPEGFDFAAYRPYGGVIQQYIFAYYREIARRQ